MCSKKITTVLSSVDVIGSITCIDLHTNTVKLSASNNYDRYMILLTHSFYLLVFRNIEILRFPGLMFSLTDYKICAQIFLCYCNSFSPPKVTFCIRFWQLYGPFSEQNASFHFFLDTQHRFNAYQMPLRCCIDVLKTLKQRGVSKGSTLELVFIMLMIKT